VGMEEVREQEKKVIRRIERLARLIQVQRKGLSMNRYINRYVNRYVNYVNYGAMLTRGGMPNRHRLEADARAFPYDAGDVSPLIWCVSNSVQGI